MNLEKIAELVKIIENSSLKEFSYSEGEMEIYLSKLDNPPIVAPGAAAPAAVAAAPAPATPVPAETPVEEEELYITSPLWEHFILPRRPRPRLSSGWGTK